jgi:pimeloyl-ACP methyl ester carboxylesterase
MTRRERKRGPLRVIATGIVIAFALVGALALITALGDWKIARDYPPTGRFVDVNGGRLHVVELDQRRQPTPDDLPVVLLHGASGNLGDMRVAFEDLLPRIWRVILVDRPGHGWSERWADDGASPARQAAMINEMLGQLGVERAIIVAHSFAGAVATALALDHPDRVAGLVLLAPVLNPWSTGIAWYYSAAAAPYIGPLFSWTLALPAGEVLMDPTVAIVFAPQRVPDDYVRRAAIPLVLRPQNFRANAQDVAGLHAFVTTQAPRYPGIKAPTIIITGESDTVVSPEIHSRALAAILPNSRLVMLKGVGHMPHHAERGAVYEAIAEIEKLSRR